jgi:hypothetical protein
VVRPLYGTLGFKWLMSVNECRSGMNPWGVKCTAGANKNETIFVKRDLFVIMDKNIHEK